MTRIAVPSATFVVVVDVEELPTEPAYKFYPARHGPFGVPLVRYYQIQNPTIGTMRADWLTAISLNAPATASA